MKANLIENHSCKFNRNHRREKGGFLQEIAAIVPPKPGDAFRRSHAVVTLRTYGTQAANSACIWISLPNDSRNGSGKAGGYGYHRPSAAAQEAIENAGFELSSRIDGVGDSAMQEAVLAIAEAIGHPDAFLHISHA